MGGRGKSFVDLTKSSPGSRSVTPEPTKSAPGSSKGTPKSSKNTPESAENIPCSRSSSLRSTCVVPEYFIVGK